MRIRSSDEDCAFAEKSVTPLANPNRYSQIFRKLEKKSVTPLTSPIAVSLKVQTKHNNFLNCPLSISERAETFPKDAKDIHDHRGLREAPIAGASRPQRRDSYIGV